MLIVALLSLCFWVNALEITTNLAQLNNDLNILSGMLPKIKQPELKNKKTFIEHLLKLGPIAGKKIFEAEDIRTVLFNPRTFNSIIISGQGIYVYNTSEKKVTAKLINDRFISGAIDANGHALAVYLIDRAKSESKIVFLDPETLKEAAVVKEPRITNSLSFNYNGTLLAWYDNFEITVWDVVSNTQKTRIQPNINKGYISTLKFHPTRDAIAVGYKEGAVILLDMDRKAQTMLERKDDTTPVTALGWSKNGKNLAVGHTFRPGWNVVRSFVQVWDISTATILKKITLEKSCMSINFSNDNKYLAIGEEGFEDVQLWQTKSYNHSANLYAGPQKPLGALGIQGVFYLSWKPDGNAMVGANLNDVYLWELTILKSLERLQSTLTNNQAIFLKKLYRVHKRNKDLAITPADQKVVATFDPLIQSFIRALPFVKVG